MKRISSKDHTTKETRFFTNLIFKDGHKFFTEEEALNYHNSLPILWPHSRIELSFKLLNELEPNSYTIKYTDVSNLVVREGVIYPSTEVNCTSYVSGNINNPGSKIKEFLNLRHNQDGGPAYVMYNDENEVTVSKWYFMGRLHREDGPAVVYKDGSCYWYYNNNLHRDAGPARCPASEYLLSLPPASYHTWYRHGEPYIPSAHEIISWKMNEKERATR